jgi:hypothetical protein
MIFNTDVVFDEYKNLYTGCCIFLNLFCNKNESNQKLLFPHLEIFLSHFPLQINAEDTLISIIADNISLCRKISQSVAVSILNLAKSKSKNAMKALKFLSSICMPSRTPNRSIQTFILKQVLFGIHCDFVCVGMLFVLMCISI